jgi:hypothetical protein
LRSDHASQQLAAHIYDRRLKGDFSGGEVIEAAADVIEPIGSKSILLGFSIPKFTIGLSYDGRHRPYYYPLKQGRRIFRESGSALHRRRTGGGTSGSNIYALGKKLYLLLWF